MSAIYRKYLADKSALRKRAISNPFSINQQFLIDLAGFKNLFELIDQMNISWFKQADKQSREAVLDLALILDANRASKIFEAAIGANPKSLTEVHLGRSKEIFIGFGQLEKAQSLGLRDNQKLDSENPFRDQGATPAKKTDWLRKFLDLGNHVSVEYVEDRFSHPVDNFRLANSKQHVNRETITVAVIAQRPGQELVRTVNSLLASSESPLEIMVMQQLDTAKGYRTPIDVQRFSPNVKTVLVGEDLQLHQILNRALDESSGRYLCVLTQGEILHPDALGLLKNKAKKAPVAIAKKQFIGLGFELRGESSLVALINKPLAKDFGYFDQVRIGSLDGFINRLEPKKRLSKTLSWSTLETPEDQLVIDANRHYLALQRGFVGMKSRPFVTNSAIRSFYAPRPIRFGFKLSVNRRELDSVIAMDMTNKESLAQLRALIDDNKLVGIWDLNPFWSGDSLTIPSWLVEKMNQRSVQMVYPEERITTDKLTVLDPLALASQNPKRKPRWDVVDFEFDSDFTKSIKTLFPVSEL